MNDTACIACTAYLAHYPVLVGDFECDHDAKETAFMLALADAIHGPTPEGEFTDPGWRAAQFLDEAELAFSLGEPPYTISVAPHGTDRDFAFLALVNEQIVIGTPIGNGDHEEIDVIARVGGWLTLTGEVSS